MDLSHLLLPITYRKVVDKIIEEALLALSPLPLYLHKRPGQVLFKNPVK